MPQLVETKTEQANADANIDKYIPLFNEWLMDLTPEEKEIWVWNALVEMLKIKQKRKS